MLIKTFHPQCFCAEWEWLHARAAEDPRITLIAESLPRDDLLSLYGCCDVFLSLHRSEGFGRGIAEALQMGLDVIATDFGGTDFCTGPLTHPVGGGSPYSSGSYKYADGHSWAEPDVDHAAELCRQVATSRFEINRGSAVAKTINNPFDYRNNFRLYRLDSAIDRGFKCFGLLVKSFN